MLVTQQCIEPQVVFQRSSDPGHYVVQRLESDEDSVRRQCTDLLLPRDADSEDDRSNKQVKRHLAHGIGEGWPNATVLCGLSTLL